MFRLLQRMDDASPRPAEGGGGARLQVLKPVTVLAEPGETPTEAVENWARGLDWVHWLFSSIRNRMDSLYLDRPWEESSALQRVLARHLIEAWRAAESGDAAGLGRMDRDLTGRLTAEAAGRSIKAGQLLLRSTRGARYQGVLGRLRKACEDGQTPGHFVTVWAAVGHFFQISITNVLAEYLRLEAAFKAQDGQGSDSAELVARLTRELLSGEAANLKLLAAVPESEDSPARYTNLT